MERELRIIVDDIITAVKRFKLEEALEHMDKLVELVGEEEAERIFDKIESMLLGQEQ